jgi:RNA polymerase sigma-70 factor (sigma-E family)
MVSAGDRGAEFESFASAHAASLIRLSYLLCGDRGRAEDAAQEALERVYLRWTRLDDPLPYARTVVLNVTRDRWRRVGRHEMSGVRDRDVAAASDGIRVVEDRDQLLRVLRTMPYGQRAVIVLRFWQDLSERDTATALGISVGTVKSQTSRALERLRGSLVDVGTEEQGRHD